MYCVASLAAVLLMAAGVSPGSGGSTTAGAGGVLAEAVVGSVDLPGRLVASLTIPRLRIALALNWSLDTPAAAHTGSTSSPKASAWVVFTRRGEASSSPRSSSTSPAVFGAPGRIPQACTAAMASITKPDSATSGR